MPLDPIARKLAENAVSYAEQALAISQDAVGSATAQANASAAAAQTASTKADTATTAASSASTSMIAAMQQAAAAQDAATTATTGAATSTAQAALAVAAADNAGAAAQSAVQAIAATLPYPYYPSVAAAQGDAALAAGRPYTCTANGQVQIYTKTSASASSLTGVIPTTAYTDRLKSRAAIPTVDYGAVGDGAHAAADQAGFAAAFAADQASVTSPLGVTSTYRQSVGVIVEPGTYDAGDFAFSGGAPIRMVARVPGTVLIIIPAGKYFFNQTGNPFAVDTQGIVFTGGLGVLNAANTGTNITWGVKFTDCYFFNYTECAIGNRGSDSPFLKVLRCGFGGGLASGNQVVGIAWGGLIDECVIEDCNFGGNTYHIAIGPSLSGHISIVRNYFQGGDNATNGSRTLADIWVKPNAGGQTNSGYGTVISYNKFGNELQNTAYPMPRILCASEDTSTGAYRAQYKPLITVAGDVGYISGVHILHNRIAHLSPWNAPFIQSYISGLAYWVCKDNTFDGGQPTYVVAFPNGKRIDYSTSTSIFAFNNASCGVPLRFSTHAFCQLEDKACAWPGDPNSVQPWPLSDDPSLALVGAALSPYDASFFSGTIASIAADPYGTQEYASVTGGMYFGFTDPYAGAGGPMFTEVNLAAPATQAVTQVVVDMVNTVTSSYAIKAQVTLPSVGSFGKFAVPIILPPTANPASWQFRVYAYNPVSGTADTFIGGDMILSKGIGRYGRDRVLKAYAAQPMNRDLIGGGPGAYPSDWAFGVANGTLSGITTTINSVGTDQFGAFAEITMAGTATTAGAPYLRVNRQRAMSMAYGPSIRSFVGIRLISGDFSASSPSTGADGSTGPVTLQIGSYAMTAGQPVASDTLLGQKGVAFTPGTMFKLYGRTFNVSYFNSAMVYAWPLLGLGTYAAGAVINVTFRVYSPLFQRSK